MRIELQDVTVERGGRRVLDGVDAVLDPGRFTVIMGHSGAGLSTLLKAAAGLIEPGGGRVVYDGRSLADLDGRERRALQTRTGFVFQDAALWANSTLLANLDLPLQAKHPDLGPAARWERIDSVLNSCGFAADLMGRPAMLSLGRQKVLSFLRALVPDPEALFLDEPTASLDQHGCSTLVRILDERRRQGRTLAAVTHDVRLAEAMADDLVILHEGRVLAAGPRDDVLAAADPQVRAIVHDRFETAGRAGTEASEVRPG